MCTSKGAPPHTDKRKVNDPLKEGAEALLSLFKGHDAMFLGDESLTKELVKFCKEHGVKRDTTLTKAQKDYGKVIESGLKANPSIVG